VEFFGPGLLQLQVIRPLFFYGKNSKLTATHSDSLTEWIGVVLFRAPGYGGRSWQRDVHTLASTIT
jgi:hypothetical protein